MREKLGRKGHRRIKLAEKRMSVQRNWELCYKVFVVEENTRRFKIVQTVCVRAHTRVRNVCGYSEIREPQVLYVRVAESLLYSLVEVFAGEHRGHRIGQVQNLPPPLRHFLSATIKYISYFTFCKGL